MSEWAVVILSWVAGWVTFVLVAGFLFAVDALSDSYLQSLKEKVRND